MDIPYLKSYRIGGACVASAVAHPVRALHGGRAPERP
ncbi:hypothetical protein FEQ05_03310 [Burkholderia pseudomultivorans]|uniref:Uncharacterized protein n=1 Tax=Burkholderia pseudomultivorans TaxID=1207504 RepID=A0A6P2PMZ5_9BURK|nr:hypothetical protein [Burkholderia pseudomultivorans]MDR8737675.1 hypothetical protein [Burkholderia pseudomultivorans]MDR8745058.1 hypothetical protein [Burkholderia pseudomultivorans]MDR8757667.1 hypothetical protein [Burkholderia pseudomultivorans]MDR8781797.1 hypothetical protein [Burkholderia pseudomultivorans]